MRIIVVAGVVLLAASSARAQEVPERLSLEDALRIARANSPAFSQAINGLQSAAAQQRQAWGQLLPNLTTSMSFSGNTRRTLRAEDEFGEIQEREIVEVTTSSASQAVSLQMTLFDGFGNVNRARAGQAGMRAAEAQVDAAEFQLRQEVSIAYFRAVQAELQLEVERALLASAREQLAMTEQRFQIGSANREDVLGAQATVAARERAVLQAEGEVAKSRLELLRVMGVKGRTDFTLTDGFPAVFDPSVLDADALVQTAMVSSPRVAQREAELRRAELSASAARGARLPSVSGTFSYDRGTTLDGYDAFFVLDGPNSGWRFSLNVSLPLFTRFQTSAQIAQASVRAANAREQARAERLAVETEVRQAYVDLVNAYRAVELADRALALSQERLALTQERYRTGTSVSFLQLQSAIDQASSSEQQAVQARFSYVVALVNLETKVGREVRP